MVLNTLIFILFSQTSIRYNNCNAQLDYETTKIKSNSEHTYVSMDVELKYRPHVSYKYYIYVQSYTFFVSNTYIMYIYTRINSPYSVNEFIVFLKLFFSIANVHM